MADLADGETTEVQGSGSNKYTLKNVGGAYSCSCPAWKNAGGPIEARTCKHLRAYRGDEVEAARLAAVGVVMGAPKAPKAASAGGAGGGGGSKKSDDEGPPILLAHKWEVTHDPTGWWMSEKLDGVRAYWNGKSFISRLGNPFLAPDWFLAGLPETPLDGELWGGRKKFQRTVGLVKRQDRSELWKELTYVVFDAPALDAPFEDRLEHCREKLAGGLTPYARPHEHEKCAGVDHLKTELARVESLGGEGLMLRQPGSKYHVGRSTTLLKVKTFMDAEAKVIGHTAGAGKHKGRCGALEVETPEGTRFSVGTGLSDKEREDPPAIGTIITYRFQELSDGGVPRFPSYVGVRADAEWPPKSSAKPVSKASPTKTSSGVVPQKSTTEVSGESEDGTEDADETSAPEPAPALAAGSVIRLELEDGKDSQFWEVTLEGKSYTVRSGRVGEPGEMKKKAFNRPELVIAEVEKIRARKLDEGWGEVEIASSPKVESKPAPATPATSPTETPSETKAPETPPVNAPFRRFELTEGSSSKFWEIALEGNQHTVRFGKIGTKGQSKTKTFPTPNAATSDARKLIDEKVEKGYLEKTAGASDDGEDSGDEDE